MKICVFIVFRRYLCMSLLGVLDEKKSKRNLPFAFAVNLVKNRSAMRTCVAYEIELLFSVWCLIGFLLEELISDYH